jgi:8-oxo-dGTP pyrophosphatase MutT (NUDIX family)
VSDLRETIRTNLAAFERIALDIGERRHAAVAIVVTPHEDAHAYLLTRRAAGLRRNPGMYALPGGGLDPGEDAVEAAIRETREELGVVLDRDDLLGLLDDFTTISGQVVTPVVLWADGPLTLQPDPVEVQEAWFAPLADLHHPEAPRREPHPDGGEPIARMHMRGQWINPPTAAWLYQFRDVALLGLATRVHMIGQPPWTAR